MSSDYDFFHQTIVELESCQYMTIERGQDLGAHERPGMTLLFISSGNGTVSVNNRTIQVTAKTAVVALRGAVLQIRCESTLPLKLYLFSFYLYRFGERNQRRISFDQVDVFPIEGRLVIENSARMHRLVQAIVAAQQQPRPDPFRTQDRMQELFRELLAALPKQTEYAGDSMKRTLRHMQSHYRFPITLHLLSRIAGLHPNYYAAQFKRKFGTSPIEYLTRIRMNKAKALMLNSREKMSDIARLTGFSDEFYFSRRFKSCFGMPPTAYIKKGLGPRIASLSAPYTDHLNVLGVDPCCSDNAEMLVAERKWRASRTDGQANWEWTRRELQACKPDLILCKEHIATETQMYMGDIAPVMTVPWLGLDCFGHMREIARMLDRDKQAAEWISLHEKKAEQARRKVELAIGRSSAAILAVTRKSYKLYGGRNFGHVLYRSLQLDPPDVVRREMAKHRAGTIFNWMAVQPEQISACEADFLFLLVEPEEAAVDKCKQLLASEGWRQHPAVIGKRVFTLDWNRWIGYSPQAINRQLEEAQRLLLNEWKSHA